MTSQKFSRDDFGTRVRALREARGWTQKDLAAHVGGWDSKISSWENGIPPRDPADLIRLADLLGCSIDYLLTGRETPGLGRIIDGLEDLLADARRLEIGGGSEELTVAPRVEESERPGRERGA